MIPIRRNDYWNGWVGFYSANSSKVSVDEDSGMPATLTIERRNATFGALQVGHNNAAISRSNLHAQLSRINFNITFYLAN